MAALLHAASYSSHNRGGGKNVWHGEMSGPRRVTNHPLTPIYQGNMAELHHQQVWDQTIQTACKVPCIKQNV